MRKRRLIVLLGIICVISILATLPITIACAPAEEAAPEGAPPEEGVTVEPIVLKSCSLFPKDNKLMIAYQMFVDRVNERANGELVLDWMGGSEVIEGFSQAAAVQEGVLDMCYVFPGAYAGLVPVGEALQKAQIPPWEMRENGAYDLIRAEHEKAGLYWLGKEGQTGEYFVLYLNKKVEDPKTDLAGLTCGDGTIARHFMEALGITPVRIDYSEAYTALEHGTVDGWAMTIVGNMGYGFHEVEKYVLDYKFLSADFSVLVNLDTWNSLPEHLQILLDETKAEVEKDFDARYGELADEEWQAMLDYGMEPIPVSPEDAAWLDKVCYDSEWAYLLEVLPPDLGPQIQQLLTK